MIYTKRQKVSASMAGSDECLSVIGMFQVIENAITEMMGELKIDGLTAKEKYGAFWVFVKNRVKIFKKIRWNEEFETSCFISFKSLAKMNVDVFAKTLEGELLFYAHVEECALDIATQRIRKLNTVGVDETMTAEPPLVDIQFCKFEYENLPKVESVKVRSTNIDMSHHTNNLEYLRFVLNTFSVQELEERPIKEMEVIYANQSFENDIIDVYKISLQDKDVLVLQKGDTSVVKCEILF